jgi:hypothetical protein
MFMVCVLTYKRNDCGNIGTRYCNSGDTIYGRGKGYGTTNRIDGLCYVVESDPSGSSDYRDHSPN